MYFHVIENCKRDGISGYRLVKTYKNHSALVKWLLRTGKPVWVESSNRDYIVANGGVYGGHTVSYWNTGGWGSTTMPVLPIFGRK
jgi:hypothetical protein